MYRFDFNEHQPDRQSYLDSIKSAHNALVKDGFAIVDNVLSLELVRSLKAEFTDKYQECVKEIDRQDVLKVGNKRYLITIELSGAFQNQLIYANPSIMPLIKMALGEDIKLESFGIVLALPGAKSQHIHRDGSPLFDNGISSILPMHALTVVFPLVEMNGSNGTTAIWAGSHRWLTFEHNPVAENAVPIVPVIPEGSCAIWDFRSFHSGTENYSSIDRPIVYMTYARRWWQDPLNFRDGRQKRILIGDGFIQSVPEDCRDLFPIDRDFN